ncbi:serine/arginine repetitive matrix protein 1-like [Calypte anna]|uniref:serine/arginine repetitive matrix protein 1-like n=1 Tax=Calypte anna TaxID=9244 RepID=UPI0011C3915E|nr:serine/arginine repetitive matrix protein 1-like [Calypte anna]
MMGSGPSAAPLRPPPLPRPRRVRAGPGPGRLVWPRSFAAARPRSPPSLRCHRRHRDAPGPARPGPPRSPRRSLPPATRRAAWRGGSAFCPSPPSLPRRDTSSPPDTHTHPPPTPLSLRARTDQPHTARPRVTKPRPRRQKRGDRPAAPARPGTARTRESRRAAGPQSERRRIPVPIPVPIPSSRAGKSLAGTRKEGVRGTGHSCPPFVKPRRLSERRAVVNTASGSTGWRRAPPPSALSPPVLAERPPPDTVCLLCVGRSDCPTHTSGTPRDGSSLPAGGAPGGGCGALEERLGRQAVLPRKPPCVGFVSAVETTNCGFTAAFLGRLTSSFSDILHDLLNFLVLISWTLKGDNHFQNPSRAGFYRYLPS